MSKMEMAITGFFTLISLWFGNFAIAFIILFACNIVDYISRIIVSKKNGVQIKSDIGIAGIKKKVALWLLCVVGFIIDLVIMCFTSLVQIQVPFHFFFATAVACWLIFNELISILENCADGGAEIPKFLLNIPRTLKTQIENKSDITNNGGNSNAS